MEVEEAEIAKGDISQPLLKASNHNQQLFVTANDGGLQAEYSNFQLKNSPSNDT
jgi:hypothetical protein